MPSVTDSPSSGITTECAISNKTPRKSELFNADAQSYRVCATSVHIWVHQSVLSA
ncbi:hypothetical protein WM42_2241 [Corynebacterium simulans]|nr:hypothetical protein WM42_2241 [Corynebacterium simulans]